MNIELNQLNYPFQAKPILIGGMAMEYYGLRQSGSDIDFIATDTDVANLIKLYPTQVKDLSGDLGVCPLNFEIWKTINYFDYDFYNRDCIETDRYKIVSLEKLLFMKTLAIDKDKYFKDVKLIINKIIATQNQLRNTITFTNQKLVSSINNISYIERR